MRIAGGTGVPVADFSLRRKNRWKKEKEPAAAACDVKSASFPFRPDSVERVRMFLSTFFPTGAAASCSFCF